MDERERTYRMAIADELGQMPCPSPDKRQVFRCSKSGCLQCTARYHLRELERVVSEWERRGRTSSDAPR